MAKPKLIELNVGTRTAVEVLQNPPVLPKPKVQDSSQEKRSNDMKGHKR